MRVYNDTESHPERSRQNKQTRIFSLSLCSGSDAVLLKGEHTFKAPMCVTVNSLSEPSPNRKSRMRKLIFRVEDIFSLRQKTQNVRIKPNLLGHNSEHRTTPDNRSEETQGA